VAYYGQLARERLGLGEMALRPVPQRVPGEGDDVIHAAELLYAIGERDLALSFAIDLAEHSDDVAVVAALADVAEKNGDARAVMLVGQRALARGLPLELYAFPAIGVPSYAAIGPPLERSIVYSIVRTESEFNQRDVSPAKAVGLMQVTPEAGRDTAKRLGIAYDWQRLVSDPVYNTQMGAGELAALLAEYRGCYIMSFAGYNAGRGRVHEWVVKHGDPRDAKVDAVDWVERIPISETRNYVQRVMENLAVYRVRFSAATAATDQPGADARTAGTLPVPPSSAVQEAVAK
jgi:soluble lytic murein transglycosylase